MTLSINSVSKAYLARGTNKTVQAVNDVSAVVEAGQTLGVIGESGCGKSTLARLIAGLEPPTSGSITFDGQDVTTFNSRNMRDYRRRVQMVFQDPYSSLNPRLTAGAAIEEVVKFHHTSSGQSSRDRVLQLLSQVGLNERFADAFPAQMSGGQRQRVCIARALAASPELLILDEPVSALDVSVRAGIMNLLQDLKEELNLTYIFISHDLGMVKHISDTVMVMYLGRMVEYGAVANVMNNTTHPYSRALLKAAPNPATFATKLQIEPVLTGEVPSPTNPPQGCGFNPRCEFAMDQCRVRVPDVIDINHAHSVRCVLANSVASTT